MSYYVIVDLEMCNVPKSVKKDVFKCRNEIIQIGAVLVNGSLEIVDEFMTYVSPEYGRIDDYIQKLTGITEKDLCGAPRIKEALEMLVAWMPEDAVAVSWSDNDKCQISRELQAKGIVIQGLDAYLESWIDCQKTFAEKMNSRKCYKLSEALIIADIFYDDGEHDALVDAKNTAQLFIKMEKEPVLRLNPYYSNQVNQTAYCPFAKLLASYKPA